MAPCYSWNPTSADHACKERNYQKPYTCDGCRRPGFGSRSQCDKCNMTLHLDCTIPLRASSRNSSSIALKASSHHFSNNFNFTFHNLPPLTRHGNHERYCDACGKIIIGFVYHCKKDNIDWDFHPCCLNLKKTLLIGGSQFMLKTEAPARECIRCRKKNIDESIRSKIKGWSYKFGNDCIHVSCVTDMMLEEWKKKQDRGRDNEQPLSLANVDLNEILARGRSRHGGGGRSNDREVVEDIVKRFASFLLGDPVGLAFDMMLS